MRKAFFFAFCFLAVDFMGAVPLADLVGADGAKSLIAGESVKDMRVKVSRLSLAPFTEQGKKLQSEVAAFSPDVLVEAQYLYRTPEASAGRSWTEAERLAVFNVLRSLSTLSGIEYYSASRGRMRVFYESSAVVSGPEGRDRLPDPFVSAIPETSTLYALQKDLTFGENRYRYDYDATGRGLVFTQTNLTTMSYGIVPILGKERLRTIVLIDDVDEGLFLYAVSAAKLALIPGLEGKIKNSFSNRADAIFSWFSLRMDASLGVKR